MKLTVKSDTALNLQLDCNGNIEQLIVRETNTAAPHDIRLVRIKGETYLNVQNSLIADQLSISSCEFTQILNSSDIRINFKTARPYRRPPAVTVLTGNGHTMIIIYIAVSPAIPGGGSHSQLGRKQ